MGLRMRCRPSPCGGDPKRETGTKAYRRAVAAFVFNGVLLPIDSPGEFIVGAGAPSPLPGSYAVTGLVDAHCHFTVDIGENEEPFVSGRAFADRRITELAHDGVTLIRDVGGSSEITLDYARS